MINLNKFNLKNRTFSTSSSSTKSSSPEVVKRILSFPVSGSAEPHFVAGVKPPRCNNQILSELIHACSCARCSSDRAYLSKKKKKKRNRIMKRIKIST